AVRTATLADSSPLALAMAEKCLPADVERRHVDLMELPCNEAWDTAFLLDVLEHLPDQERVLTQIRRALVPGGLLFITVPALRGFWSWNDDWCRHLRRYNLREFVELSDVCGFRLLDARYFMFLLSPLLLASRYAMKSRTFARSDPETWEKAEH